MSKYRLILAGIFLLQAILIDFVSAILSTVADASLIGMAIWAAWPVLEAAWQTRS